MSSAPRGYPAESHSLRLSTLSLSIFTSMLNLLSSLGYLGIFALMLMESATLPVPSEVVLPFAGYLVSQGQVGFWAVVVVASLGSLAGTLIDYFIGYYLGRSAIVKYGRIIHLSEAHLRTSERWFKQYGGIAVLLARFVPLIRTLVAFPAGIGEMKVIKFVAYSFVGIFVWDAVLIYIGVQAGKNATAIADSMQRYFAPIGLVAIVVAILFVFLRSRGRGKKNVSPDVKEPRKADNP